MKRYAMAAICAALLLGLLAAPASAFCVYNKTDVRVGVIQKTGCVYGRGFSKYIDPGERACCNWKNHDCNKHGHKHSIVTFTVGPAEMPGKDCTHVKVKAGGWMDIHTQGDHFGCTAHYE